MAFSAPSRQTRISNNQINGDGKTPNCQGIILGAPSARVMYGTQLTGNHISNLTGAGITVSTARYS